MANGLSDDLAQAALMGQTPEEEQNNLMQAGLGLGGAAFAAQTGRAPTPVPMGVTPEPFPTGSNLPTNPMNPALGSSGGTSLPPQPTVDQVRSTTNPNRPVIVGQPRTTGTLPLLGPTSPQSPVPTGSVTTGNQLVPQNQLATQGPDLFTEGDRTRQPRAGGKSTAPVIDVDVEDARMGGRSPTPKPSALTNIVSDLTKGAIVGSMLTPNTMGDATIDGAINSRLAAGQSPEDIAVDFGLEKVQEVMNPYGISTPTTTPSARSVEEIIAQGQAEGGYSAELLAELTETQKAGQEETARFEAIQEERKLPTSEYMQAVGEFEATPTLDQASRRKEQGMEIFPDAPGPAAAGIVYGAGETAALPEGIGRSLTPGGGDILIDKESGLEMRRTIDPNTGQVVFADVTTANRFSDQIREQRMADFQAQQRAIQQLAQSGQGFQRIASDPMAAASAARVARMDARPDFMTAVPGQARGGGRYTDDQLRDITGGGAALQQAKGLQDAGIDPVSKDRFADVEQEARLDQVRFERQKQALEEEGFAATDVETDPETGVINQIFKKGDEVRRVFKGVARAPQVDISSLSPGFVSTDNGTSGYTEDQESNISKVMKRFDISRAEAIKELEQANRL